MTVGIASKVDGQGRPLTPWMGAVPPFRADAPPRDWERWHDGQFTRRGILRRSAMTAVNRPVPRLASHHYRTVERDQRTVYFY